MTYGGEVEHEGETSDGEDAEEVDDVWCVCVRSHVLQSQLRLKKR